MKKMMDAKRQFNPIHAFVLFFALCISFVVTIMTMPKAHAAWSGSGKGTEDDPYIISTKEQLVKFADIVNGANGETRNLLACAKLATDVTLDNEWTPIGDYGYRYGGTFDGQGHTITYDYYSTVHYENYYSFFYYVGESGIVRNLNTAGNIKSAGTAAGITFDNAGLIENCINRANITGSDNNILYGDHNGIAHLNDGTISKCGNEGNIYGRDDIAGICGLCSNLTESGIIINCYNIGDINLSGQNGGGIVGQLSDATMSNCFSTALVPTTDDENDRRGAISGAAVSGATIKNCYFLNGDAVYGYSHSSTTVVTDSGKLTAEQFKNQASFHDWDFDDVWEIKDGADYPSFIPTVYHTHEFTYSVNGATITATCSAEGCSLTDNKATLTIVAPEDLVYDGNSKEATLNISSNDVFGTPTISYYKGTQAVDECINAGTYTAKVTFENVTAELSFTIEKATPAEPTKPTCTATYGQKLSDIASQLTTGWTWETPTNLVGNVGSRTHNAIYTPADSDNYKSLTREITVTVSKATPTYTVPTDLVALVGKTLADVVLPTGFSFNDPLTTSVGNVGKNTFKATFTPSDTENYVVVNNIDIEILVEEGREKIVDDTNGVSVETKTGDKIPNSIELKVELKTKENTTDYETINKILKNQKINKIYDIKLIQITGGIEKEIQPKDIKEGMTIIIRITIPEGINPNRARIVHVHNGVATFIDSNAVTVENNEFVFEVSELSDFAIVSKSNSGFITESHGFCAGWVVFIFAITLLVYLALYILIHFGLCNALIKALRLEGLKNVLKLLGIINVAVSGAICIFALVTLILHTCPISLVSFILVLLATITFTTLFILTLKKGNNKVEETKEE